MNTSRISAVVCAFLVFGWSASAHAYSSAEVLTTEAYQYGRFEASIEFPAGSGVIGSFFLWKDGSEVEGTFWNELDFETLGFDCHLETNAYYGNPAQYHVEQPGGATVCGDFHTFGYEWTPDYIAWLVDGVEVRRETGETAAAYRDNAADGMQIRFNVWPGDASFGGTFDASLLPVYQRIDWVQYSSYDGSAFVMEWREDFDDLAIPPEWEAATWDSPKGLSTHSIENAGVVDGFLVLALTADDAQGIPGVSPTTTTTTGAGGLGGTTGSGGTEPTGGAGGIGGSTSTGGTSGTETSTISTTVSTTATTAATTTSVGGATATSGAASVAGSSLSSATTSSATATATSSPAASTTAGATTAGTATADATALDGSGGSSGSAADAAADDTGCACRTAGHGHSSGLLEDASGFALLALGAALRVRRRSNR